MLCGSRCWRGVCLTLFALLCSLPMGARAAVVVVESRVATSSDDAEQRIGGTGVSLTSSDLELATDGSPQTVGMRFAGLGIPRGAVVRDAWLQFNVDEPSTLDAASLTIRAQASDNAPTFTTASNNLGGRTAGS